MINETSGYSTVLVCSFSGKLSSGKSNCVTMCRHYHVATWLCVFVYAHTQTGHHVTIGKFNISTDLIKAC